MCDRERDTRPSEVYMRGLPFVHHGEFGIENSVAKMFTIIVGQNLKAFSIWFIEARMSPQVTLRYQGAVAMPNRPLGRKVSRPTAKTLHSLVDCLPRASSLISRCGPGDW